MAAKKPRPDFSHLTLGATPAPTPAVTAAAEAVPVASHAAPAELPKGNIKQRAKSMVLYLNPAGHKNLKLYAVEAGRPMHDLVMEALEDWCRRQGITTPMRSTDD
jgi:hypothetical protein